MCVLLENSFTAKSLHVGAVGCHRFILNMSTTSFLTGAFIYCPNAVKVNLVNGTNKAIVLYVASASISVVALCYRLMD